MVNTAQNIQFYNILLLQLEYLKQVKTTIVRNKVYDTQEKFYRQSNSEMKNTHLTNSRMRQLHNVHQPRGQNH